MKNTIKTRNACSSTNTEGAKILQLLRALGTEEQRIAFAVLEGMKLQKAIDSASADGNKITQEKEVTA